MGLFNWFRKSSSGIRWDSPDFIEQMKRSTSPVSAFFIIDSPEAISQCARELARLSKYQMPSMDTSPYFVSIREIYQSRKEVLNFDHELILRWDEQEYPALLRCHSVDAGRYEIELWLPGVIANDARQMFGDGHKGFFCAFMPPSFND